MRKNETKTRRSRQKVRPSSQQYISPQGDLVDKKRNCYTFESTYGYTIHVCDTMICGAGIAGLYTATELAKRKASSGTPHGIMVFEKDKRAGGRLHSTAFPNSPFSEVAYGGMRAKDDDLIMNGLIKRMGLKQEKFDYPVTYYYLREQMVPADQLAQKGTKLYGLKDKEANKTPDELVEMALINALYLDKKTFSDPALKQKFLDDLESFRFHGHPLRQVGWINLLQNQLSDNAISFIKDADGYDSNYENMPATDAITDLFCFQGGFKSTVGGYSRVTDELAKELESLGGDLHLSYEAKEIDKLRTDSKITIHKEIIRELKYRRLPQLKHVVRVKNNRKGKTEYVVADRVVLAMPKKDLLKLDDETILFDQATGSKLPARIHSVNALKSVKVYLQFEYPWWKKLRLLPSKMIGGSRIRMIYLFPTEGELNPNDPHNSSCNMLIYMDQQAAKNFPNYTMEKDVTTPIGPEHYELRDFIYHELRKMFSQLDKDLQIPIPPNMAFRFWEEAYHCYGKNVCSAEVRRDMIRPHPDLDVHVIGSAYSNQQSWAEGALITAEFLLQEEYKLDAPEHLPPGYAQNNLLK